MDNSSRKLILYIASSLDGYIAKPGDDLSFLSMVEKEGEDYGYADFIQTIDTIILGRKTYDWVTKNVGTSHYKKKTYVMTRSLDRLNTQPPDNISYCTLPLKELVEKLKSNQDNKDSSNNHIFCDGGSEIIHQLLNDKLIDEIIVSIIPILLGDGIRLFKDGRPEQKLQLLNSKSFPSTGLVQLNYKVLN
eukprot:gene784-975_t